MRSVTMFSKWAILVTCVIISACDSFSVKNVQKCTIKDEKCFIESVSKVLKDISETGVEEINVPALDPMHLKNISVPILGLLNLLLEEGQLKGVKDCEINKYQNDFVKGEANLEITCDLVLKGKFKVSDPTPFLQNLLGSDPITIDGNVKIILEKLRMNMQFLYDLIKKDDGDIYFKCHKDDFNYKYDVGNAKLVVHKILLGGQDSSELVMNIFNQNGKFIMETFGKSIFDVGMPIFYDILHRFIDSIPVKYYFSDDFTSYVKNV
ncbi:uncharacterized protein LOC125066829 [Vanessa atalanta]|uniref:uncharacterized protein LOC125066829 n=1 Tax=Vanessa atalanta TaxID=42275 RepID=UPI001FCDA828|nr:uncharacterized protein LOC125066829 [Vanessa atalanta]